jgi:NADH:ubiquinone oxidoreductase subunit F (NADH-binding)
VSVGTPPAGRGVSSRAGRSLPRLLTGLGERPMASLASHLDAHGPLPDLRRRAGAWVAEQVQEAGLRGRGGAAFPVARKLRAVSSRTGATVVLANGAEGEPASRKDRVLLRELPHLVLDGVSVAAHAVGAREAVIAVSEADVRGARGIEQAVRERQQAGLSGDPGFTLMPTPESFISGQETALVNWANAGLAKPTFTGARPFERGIQRMPTLVQNVETLAHLALIARHGPDWFRALGTPADPGSALVTVVGQVGAPGVYEIEHGTPLEQLLEMVGAPARPTGLLLGGYFGSWLEGERIPELRLSPGELSAHGASLGAGVVAVLGPDACPVAETARVTDYLASQSAGQCGPCVHGLAAVADVVQRLAAGLATAAERMDLSRWIGELPGRGACQHPDGAVRFLSSALRVFADEFADHAHHGPCQLCAAPAVLPVAPTHPVRRLAA